MTPEIARVAADWWAERFVVANKRDAFRTELLRRLVGDEIDENDQRGFGVSLATDYDPQGTLLDVVRAVGVECRGFMDSCDGILPRKRKMWIRKDGSIEVADGRRSQFEWLIAPAAATDQTSSL